MVARDFSHVKTWVFDLDNTLYPPSVNLFGQIETRMTAWVMDELGVDRTRADQLRRDYWQQHGTTLAGLMREHDVDPLPYLTHVHDIDFSVLPPSPDLAAAIAALEGRRIVYTNGSANYAWRVLEARGLAGQFDAVYGIEDADFHPKPDKAAFDTVFAKDGVQTDAAAMFEDEPRNLAIPHDLGMRTVHVAPAPHQADHIHHHTNELTKFLRKLK